MILDTCKFLNKTKMEIEKKLKIKIISIEPVKKKYSSTINAFFIKALSRKNIKINYFLKFSKEKNIQDEINGIQFLGNILNTPKIIPSSKNIPNSSNKWLLFEYIHGYLMSEKFVTSKNGTDMKKFFAYEKSKESNLKILHSQKTIKMNYARYIKSRTNRDGCKTHLANFLR